MHCFDSQTYPELTVHKASISPLRMCALQAGMGKWAKYGAMWLNNVTGISAGVNYTFTDADYQRCQDAASYVNWLGGLFMWTCSYVGEAVLTHQQLQHAQTANCS
jgi:hypothetical protein